MRAAPLSPRRPARGPRIAVILATAIASILATAIAAANEATSQAAPPCFAVAAFEPAEAFPGQQVLYRVRVFRRADVSSVEWNEPPLFRGLRAEWLPGLPDAGEALRAGVRYRVSEEHRAVFPQRDRDLGAAPSSLRCVQRDGDGERVHTAEVPGAPIRGRPLPDAGRPADFAGLVGPLALAMNVSPRTLSLGQSVRVAVMFRGAGNLWDVPAPLPVGAVGDAEVFPLRPELRLEPGDRPTLRRHFAFDVVPRSVGALRIPALRVAYFDPAEARYREAVSPEVTLQVGPRPAVSGAGEPSRDRSEARPGAAVAGRPLGTGGWVAIAALALLGVSAGAGVLALRRLRSAGRGSRLAAADAAHEAGDTDAEAAVLGQALREALARTVPDARSAAPEALLARSLPPKVAAAARVLAALERSRYDPAAISPGRAAVEQALALLD